MQIDKKYIKNLLKKYHPDLCTDSQLRNTYNEITIKLIKILYNLENKEIELDFKSIENKNFNIFNFRYYFAKIQSIGISKKSIKNKDFLFFRDILISEINKHNEKIGMYFTDFLSDKNLNNKYIVFFAKAYAGYNCIFQNYFQYNDHVKNHCIKVSGTYFNDYIRKCGINGIEQCINESIAWLNNIGDLLYKQRQGT